LASVATAVFLLTVWRKNNLKKTAIDISTLKSFRLYLHPTYRKATLPKTLGRGSIPGKYAAASVRDSGLYSNT
jgi:hypothetical protein